MSVEIVVPPLACWFLLAVAILSAFGLLTAGEGLICFCGVLVGGMQPAKVNP